MTFNEIKDSLTSLSTQSVCIKPGICDHRHQTFVQISPPPYSLNKMRTTEKSSQCKCLTVDTYIYCTSRWNTFWKGIKRRRRKIWVQWSIACFCDLLFIIQPKLYFTNQQFSVFQIPFADDTLGNSLTSVFYF